MRRYFKIILCLIIFVLFFTVRAMAATAEYNYNNWQNDTSIIKSEIIREHSALFQIQTDKEANCKYSRTKSTLFENMEGTFEFVLGNTHKKQLTSLTDSVYKYYVRCKSNDGNTGGELEAVFGVSLPVSASIILDKTILKAGKIELNIVTSKSLSEKPSLSYSLDGISYDPVQIIGAEKDWSGYFIIPNNAGEKIGSFKFQGKDLEGFIGTEITSGNIFFIDTTKPETIVNIKATGLEGRIELKWDLEEEITQFKIYKSEFPNVGFSNFFKKVEAKSFVDTDVQKGKTYYYRVSAIDPAENEGDLSIEVYATALLANISSESSGLDLRYHGLLDSMIVEIESVIKLADEIKNDFVIEESAREIYEDMKLEREIESAKSELVALKRETESYRAQALSKEELDKKLNSGKLKLTTIKRKIPESTILTSELETKKSFSEEDIRSLILSLNPTVTESNLKKQIEKSLEAALSSSFNIATKSYNAEIVFLDGTRKEYTIIKESIEGSLEKNENFSIIELVPKEIAESAQELDIKNINYKVLKDDPVLEFESGEKEIIYAIDKKIDLNFVKNIKTILMYNYIPAEENSSGITGYVVFSSLGKFKTYYSLIAGLVILAALSVYLFFLKKDNLPARANEIQQRIMLAQDFLAKGKKEKSKEIYSYLSADYKALPKKEKKGIYPQLIHLHNMIKWS